MKLSINANSRTAATAAASLALMGVGALPVSAQVHHGFLHRHRMAASIAAGIAAHHYATKGARGRAAHGQRPNFAERHPILSGVGAAAATHHILKK